MKRIPRQRAILEDLFEVFGSRLATARKTTRRNVVRAQTSLRRLTSPMLTLLLLSGRLTTIQYILTYFFPATQFHFVATPSLMESIARALPDLARSSPRGHLQVSWQGFNGDVDATCAALTAALAAVPKLAKVSLDFNWTQLSNAGAAAVAALLRPSSGVTSVTLDLSSTNVTDLGISHLACALQNLPLQTLNLSFLDSAELSNKSLRRLTEAVQRLSHLSNFSLFFSASSALKNCPNVQAIL
eukprot:TRINITY_DN6252_c0_g1_i1.p1 TRINITY_DN6252_c0_g1~~TRINITY_DN6252_c0_g1_i1.p1  ORF type:complete len:243 (+),score=27.16 TRINITY_DN6252_c0_g1_i1:1388-2116(+)